MQRIWLIRKEKKREEDDKKGEEKERNVADLRDLKV